VEVLRVKVAIIPARGGSKRIPRKNIRPFAGKPIIAYSISAAQDSRLFDRVIVSTDDEDIATVAREFGAETPFTRPAALSDDFTGTNVVARHAIQWLLEQGCAIDYACCIYATAPFLRTRYLRLGFDKLLASEKSFAFSVTSFSFSIWRAVRILPDGTVNAIYPENFSKRSQDLEEAYHDAGQFYWGTARAFLDEVVTFSPAAVPVVLPRYLVHDIDTLEDWERAELMFGALQQCDRGSGQS
jgi:pseudaminic acid cytidylyltransferase